MESYLGGFTPFPGLPRCPFRCDNMQPMLWGPRTLVGWLVNGRFALFLSLHTAPQCIHEVNHLGLTRGLLFERQREMLQLGLDQFAERGFIGVGELFGIEF